MWEEFCIFARKLDEMRNQLMFLSRFFCTVAVIMVVFQILFMLLEPACWPINVSNIVAVIWHGLPMTLCMSAYLSIIPWLFSLITCWVKIPFLKYIGKGYVILIAVLIALIYTFDAALYPYWNFRLDYTPIFYFITSPSAALASITFWMYILGIITVALLFFGIYKFLISGWKRYKIWEGFKSSRKKFRGINYRVIATSILVLTGGLLFLFIRGGISVATMTPGRVYFSEDVRLNHAALNPMFNLLYSATHQKKPLVYMDNNQADSIVAKLFNPTAPLNSTLSSHPDVYIIILESFSAHLLPSFGGEEIATNLDEIAKNSITFKNAYSSSFRTDRSLTAILSGFPALPNTSLLKYTDRLDKVPSVQRSMKQAGYHTSYYYGGDINFTNVKAWLVAAGMDEIIADTDFPVGERMSKWGVHDGPLFERVISDIDNHKISVSTDKPRLTIIQTSSSHEPFEVPYNADPNIKINAFKYTDNELGKFISALKERGVWDKALIVITPDHYGAYPEDLVTADERHHIPIIFTGGALSGREFDESILNRPLAQTDIPASILSLLGIDHSDFPYSNDAFSAFTPQVAFFSEPSWGAIKDTEGITVMSAEPENPLPLSSLGGDNNENRLDQIKAILQQVSNSL